jgi:hypothetical protein
LRSRDLAFALIAMALPAGVARAQAPSNPRQAPSNPRPAAPPQPAAQQPNYPAQQPNYPGYSPFPPGPETPGQQVPQRYDTENPKLRFRPAADPAAPGGPPKRGTMVEAASSGNGSSKVQVETPAARQRVTSPSQVEQLVQRSTTSIDFFDLVDDIMDELTRQLAREDPNLIGPMAIKLVRLSSNLRPEFARTIESRLIARVTNATSVKIAICPECTSVRSRVEDGQWVLTLGAVNADDLRRIGAKTGVKTFMEVDFTYSPTSNVVWMSAVVYRASDGAVVWSDAYRSDATAAVLLRTGQRIPSRAERVSELERKIAARPYYGFALGFGIAQIGYAGATGDIVGGTISARFHEKFGESLNSLFGLTLSAFLTGAPNPNMQPQALNSVLMGAYYSYDLSPPNLNRPEVWIYSEGGGMFTGNEGNTFYVESGLDTHLKWRMSLQGGLMYMFHTKFSGQDLGGVGFRLRVGVNW